MVEARCGLGQISAAVDLVEQRSVCRNQDILSCEDPNAHHIFHHSPIISLMSEADRWSVLSFRAARSIPMLLNKLCSKEDHESWNEQAHQPIFVSVTITCGLPSSFLTFPSTKSVTLKVR